MVSHAHLDVKKLKEEAFMGALGFGLLSPLRRILLVIMLLCSG